jgi:site-specific recombinase XerD
MHVLKGYLTADINKKIGPHILRHSFAMSFYKNSGQDLKAEIG